MKTTTKTIRDLKGERPIVALTAYDYIMAKLADEAGTDLLLVGDSVGTTMLGFETTIPVTLDMMVHHTAAVARARPEALLVGDMPFAAGRHSHDRTLDACARLMQEGGAEAVKIEGGSNIAGEVERLVQAGVPILGHIGLMPQKFHEMGGYRRFGKKEAERKKILEDARALQEAGAFAIIGEMMDHSLAAEVTGSLAVPFIGIGCGPSCDGQVLVSTDVLGYGIGKYPSFAKTYVNMAEIARKAFRQYADEVKSKTFPS